MASFVNQTFRFGKAFRLDKRDFAKKSQNIISLSIMLMMAQASNSYADELVKTIPPQSFNIPAGDLTKALSEYSATAGVLLSFDSDLTHDKNTQGLKGQYTVKDGFTTLLKDSGLEIINNKKGELELRKAPAVKISESDNLPLNAELKTVEVRAKRFYEIGPLPGLGLTKEQIPGNVQSITAKEIKESHSLSLTDLMNKKLQSVTVNDYQGNPFQMDVQYRGFTAGPEIGTPQGLSVFFDGIRVNEPFGDVVNWDMIPMNALAGVDVFPGSNPIFGLNTLGGAFTVKTKDGFNHEGFDAEVLSGSFGRKQLQVEGGWNNGTIALFGAGNFFLEDGWRENSPSKVNQFFGKASYRGDKLDLNLSTLIVGTDLVGNGLIPSEMYAQDRNGSFTSEDETKNRLQQFQLSSSYFVNDNFTITGQVYRRNSKRHQTGGDVMTEYNEQFGARRLPNADEEHTCILQSSTILGKPNLHGIPNYLVVPINVTQGEDYTTSPFVDAYLNGFGATPTPGVVDLAGTFNPNLNAQLPDDIAAKFKAYIDFNKDFFAGFYDQSTPTVSDSDPVIDVNVGVGIIRENAAFFGTEYFGSGAAGSGYFANALAFTPGENVSFAASLTTSYYYTKGGINGTDDIKNYVVFLPAINGDKCQQDLIGTDGFNVGPYGIRQSDGSTTLIDGALFGQPGYIPGTPTAVINDNKINQITDGASIQFNWNFEQHKFMVGASIDAASADYSNASQLGFLTTDREAYLDPAQAHPQFTTAYIPLRNNDFSGTNTTKSVYFSETWTPVKEWNFSASARYNETQTKNKIASRYGFFNYGIGDIRNIPNAYDICTDLDGDCLTMQRNFRARDLKGTLDAAETEKFSFYSFNPSLGATWQAKENLNVFANWAQGTRTPSVVELGCALDKTPVGAFFTDDKGNLYQQPKSVAENRECRLPTTLSGDPFLPQIKANTYDLGMRGNIGENVQWNLGAYQTDLKDDIYFVAVGNGAGFFDSIGNTRRRGLEAGLSGKKDKLSFSLNYGLTDATFQNNFQIFSEDNSTAANIVPLGAGVIQVKKGNRMPGVSLHNLNASVGYDVTDKWKVGLSMVMHSESFVRGNENNAHKKGVVRFAELRDVNGNLGLQALPPTNNPGKLSGYAFFNFQTSYQLAPEWTATMLVNNVFDKEFFSAGRLGRNPFSPSINGAIGPSGYNHNSNDWLSTNFIAPSAPRGIWFSLRYSFVPDKK